MTVRPPAVAGTFYTDDARVLARDVDRFLAAAPTNEGPAPKALVVPHAGYVYSGEIAGRGYATVRGRAREIRKVVLLGPAHRVAVRSMAVPSVKAFRTPLGEVAIDEQLRSTALRCRGVALDDEAHAPEHSIEVHLPFLQRLLEPGFTLLPVLVGGATPPEVADLLAALWGGDETLVLVSSDLSHYEAYDAAARHDAATARTIVDGAWERLDTHDACGAYPLRGLLAFARNRGARLELLDLRSSGDTAGDRRRVVGYGAFAVHEHPPSNADDAHLLDRHEQGVVLDTAVSALEAHLGGTLREVGERADAEDLVVTPRLRRPGASFVTLLNARHELLGCLGTLEPRRPLLEDVQANAVAAATRDPRFAPVQHRDLSGGELHVSVLSPHEALAVHDREQLLARLRPGIDGLLIEAGRHRATFLPSVWEQLPDAEDFLDRLWQKAGLRTRTWPADLAVWRYGAQGLAQPLIDRAAR